MERGPDFSQPLLHNNICSLKSQLVIKRNRAFVLRVHKEPHYITLHGTCALAHLVHKFRSHALSPRIFRYHKMRDVAYAARLNVRSVVVECFEDHVAVHNAAVFMNKRYPFVAVKKACHFFTKEPVIRHAKSFRNHISVILVQLLIQPAKPLQIRYIRNSYQNQNLLKTNSITAIPHLRRLNNEIAVKRHRIRSGEFKRKHITHFKFRRV